MYNIKYRRNSFFFCPFRERYLFKRGIIMKTMLTDSLTITIKSDGHKIVSANCNDITVKAKCNDTDTFNLSKGTHMALKRLIDKMKESVNDDSKFKVGDIVEIIDTEVSFLSPSIGLQGIIIGFGHSDRPFVKLPINVNDDNTWAYNINNLKLIRKASK